MTNLKPLANYLIDNMTYDDYIASIRYPGPALEDYVNPDSYAFHHHHVPIDRYQPPVKQTSTVVRTDARTYTPAQVMEALGLSLGRGSTVELTLSLDQAENHLVVTTSTTTRTM